MIQLYTAPRLTPLLAHVTHVMRAAPLAPRAAETIVVQSQGMRRWVTLQLADALGCVGSLALPFPASLIHTVASEVLGQRASPAGSDAFSRDALTWRIEQLLRALPADDVYGPLRRYLRGNDERARLGLARQIAARFDDYQLYRPDALIEWEAGGTPPAQSHLAWQAALWRTLCTVTDVVGTYGGSELRMAIAALAQTPPRTLTRLTVFGVSALPPVFIDLLAALSRHIPVSVYAALPTLSHPHPLVQSMGVQGGEFLDAIVATGATHISLAERDTAPSETLLGALQRELTSGETSTPLALRPGDRSLQVHSAHGDRRQLEVVRDQLLAALASDATLRPHDLLLLVPDVAKWAPLVDAVFAVAEPDLPQIRFRLADRPTRGADSAREAFLQLLALHGGRFTHSEVFALLEQPNVHAAAGLTATEVASLRALTYDANMRWGYDAASRVALGLPAYDDGTWRAALDRLLLGVVTGRDDALTLGLLPHAGDTAGDTATLAQLADWADRLAETLVGWAEPRTMSEWSDAFRSAVAALLTETHGRGDDDLNTLRALVGDIAQLAAQSRHTEPVSIGVMRDWLELQLRDDGFGSGFLSGGMTVAALKPMRTLPFKVIAVVGLDESTFPRRDRRNAFDLLEIEPQRGDRSARNDDRQLFLDLLLAAESQLILTYSGRAIRDNSPRAASVVVDELLTYLERRTGAATRELLVVEHPLQPFSPRYFTPGGDPRLFTFSEISAQAAEAGQQPDRIDAPFVTSVHPASDSDRSLLAMSVDDLVACWRNPSKYYCQHTLGLTIREELDSESDDELLLLDSLTQGKVKASLLATSLAGGASAQSRHTWQRLQAAGELPPGALGTAWATALQATVDTVMTFVPQHIEPRSVAIDVTGAGWRLRGVIDGVRGTERYVVRAGGVRPDHRIRAWVEHVVLCAALQTANDVHPPEPAITTIIVGREGAKHTYPPLPNAVAVLDSLVAGARSARSAPLPLFPQAAVAWLDAMDSNAKRGPKSKAPYKDPRAAADKAYNLTLSTFSSLEGDKGEAHIALCFRGREPLVESWTEFEAWASRLFGALLQGGAAT